MWRLAILLASTAACDAVFNLDKVRPSQVDASFDAVIEPLSCSPTLTPGDYSNDSIVLINVIDPSLTEMQDLMYMQVAGELQYSRFAGTWSTPVPVPTLADPNSFTAYPRLSYDGQSIFFLRHQRGTNDYDLPYQSHRTAGDETWEAPTPIAFPSVFLGGDVAFGVPSADGRRVMVAHGTTGHFHLTETILVDGTWTIIDTTSALYPAGSDVSDTNSQLSPDGCTLVFTRIDRPVSLTDHEVMFATRLPDQSFGPAQKLFTNPSTVDEQHPWLAPDGNVLYYHLPAGIHKATRASDFTGP